MRTCDWCLHLRDEDDLHVVPVDDPDEIDDLVCRYCTPVDWPARFRAAAEVAERHHRPGVAQEFRMFAEVVALQPPDVVEAIGRSLLGGHDAQA